MLFRYFDPLEQALVEGELSADTRFDDLVGRVVGLRASCSPALELADADGSSVVLGVDHDRAVVLFTAADGTTRHSLGTSSGGRAMFDFFGALTQMPAHYAVPLRTALDAVRAWVEESLPRVGAVRRGPSLLLALN